MIYITQGRFTQAAMKGMVGKPEDRADQVRGLIERAGGRLVAYYITLGEYDFLVISEGDIGLDSYVATMAIVGAGGGVSDLRSTIALTSAQAKDALAMSQKIAGEYRSAGQG